MRHAYAMERVTGGVHRFTSARERDDWVDEETERREPIPRGVFAFNASRCGYFYDHDYGEPDGWPVDWR